MPDGLPPAFALFGAAALIPFLPLRARRVLSVVAPLIAWPLMHRLPQGESWEGSFLGLRLVWARADALSLVFGVAFIAVAALAALYGWHRTRRTEQVAALTYAGGGLAVVFAGDLVTMLVSWEIMAVASTFLVFARRRPAALRAGQRYLMVHLGAGAVLLLGVLFLVQQTGSTEFGTLAGLGAGAWLVLAALVVNAAVPPLHAWLPDAYPQASVSGAVFLSAFTTKSAVYCLMRGFPGSEALVWAGALMALYGVVFAVTENNVRRLLAYHIVSQVGYMVCAVGIGTPLALNGAAAHAFCHLLYKGLLFMGGGALLYCTGREKLTDMGGLWREMPFTLFFYMIGALSISGAPLFNGFVSKSLVVEAALEDGRPTVGLMLALASVGTFLSVALKLPYFAWFGARREGHAHVAPPHMLAAMGLTAALCIALGIAPGWLYARLPFPPVRYDPFTTAHVVEVLLVMAFTLAAFVRVFDRLAPHDTITLDTDWFYRRPAAWVVPGLALPLQRLAARLGGGVRRWHDRTVAVSRNPPRAFERWMRGSPPSDEPLAWYDEDRQRAPSAHTLAWVLAVFVGLAVLFSFSH
jgi:multicomponent Na+:H+ antiporter subunit D